MFRTSLSRSVEEISTNVNNIDISEPLTLPYVGAGRSMHMITLVVHVRKIVSLRFEPGSSDQDPE